MGTEDFPWSRLTAEEFERVAKEASDSVARELASEAVGCPLRSPYAGETQPVMVGDRFYMGKGRAVDVTSVGRGGNVMARGVMDHQEYEYAAWVLLRCPRVRHGEARGLEDGRVRILPMDPAPVDPKAAREARRREIDALLREDARACPAFAKARLRAVMAAMEPPPLVLARALPPGVWRAMAGAFMQKRWSQREPGGAFAMPPEAKIEMLEAKGHGPNEVTLTRDILAELHYYEAHRGGERRPRRHPGRCVPPAVAEAVEVYERSRGLA